MATVCQDSIFLDTRCNASKSYDTLTVAAEYERAVRQSGCSGELPAKLTAYGDVPRHWYGMCFELEIRAVGKQRPG